MIILRLVTQS